MMYVYQFHCPVLSDGSHFSVHTDFRYGNYNGMLESGTHAMEVITALIDGPLCFLVVFAAAHNYSWRHPLQIILCVMQLYGLLWFTLQPIYSETGLEGHFSSDPVSLMYTLYKKLWCVMISGVQFPLITSFHTFYFFYVQTFLLYNHCRSCSG